MLGPISKTLTFLGKSFQTAFLAGFLIICGGASAWAAAAKIPVSATILPLGDFCRRLGGDRVEVQVLIPPGASPHVFEPPPSVVAQAARARVFVYIGAGLEPWADRLLRARGSQGLAVVEAARGLPLLAATPGHLHEKGPGPHTPAAGNPHVWLDPVLAQEICRRITATLADTDPEHRSYYEGRLNRFLEELAALDREIQDRVAAFRLKEFVSFHPAFSYFAQRYGLREAGVLEEAPGREPTPRHLRDIVAAIRRLGIRVVFAEPQLNPRVAQVVAREAGARVLFLDPIGGRPPYGEDYLALMRHNLAILEEAMK